MSIAANEFKSYSAKSKAKRALVTTYGVAEDAVENHLQQVDGKWGFYPDSIKSSNATDAFLQAVQTELPAAETLEEQVNLEEAQDVEGKDARVVTEADSGASEADSGASDTFEEAAPVNSGVWANLMGAKPPASAAPTKRPSLATDNDSEPGEPRAQKGLKIEKDRPESNGVTQPSAGGICRQVWDHLGAQYATGKLLSLKEVREQLSYLDKVTVSVQYYRWRKHNGIVGRQAKAE